jgi:hypothetical protein
MPYFCAFVYFKMTTAGIFSSHMPLNSIVASHLSVLTSVQPNPPCNSSKQPLPGQLNLPRRLSRLETTLRNTNSLPISKLELLFVDGVGTWAVVREMDAG